MNTRTTTRTRSIGIVIGASVLATAVGATIAAADSPRNQPVPAAPAAAIDLQSVASWAGDRGYAGLSPASVGPRSAPTDLGTLADYAEAKGHTGLSPASLRPIAD